MDKRISERFGAIIRVSRITADICGADVVDPNFHINVRTVLVGVLINMSYVFLSYTGYTGFVAEGDWTIILQVLCIGGCTLTQGYCKFVTYLAKQKNIQFLMGELFSIYEEYELKGADYRLYLKRSIVLLTNATKLAVFIVTLMVLGMSSVALIVAVIFERRELVIPGEMPYVDANTKGGYIVTFITQVLFLTIGGFGCFSGDMSFIIYATQVPLLKNILRCKFDDLNEILRDEPEPGKIQKSMEAMKDILRWHQRYIVFLDTLKDIYFWQIMVQIGSFLLGIVCTIFCVVLGAWPGGVVYMIYCFVMMYVYCGIGTIIEITNDGVVDSCYNDIRWYELSLQEQKMIRIMLLMAQSTDGLSIGNVMPLSMNTGLQVTKMIYSMVMMLVGFAE